MLSQLHRFHGYNSLRSVYKHGKNVRGPLLSLKYAARQPNRPYRVAVVVSRKVHKSAVTRNRIRRRLYACVRQYAQTMPGGYDMVFTVFSDQVATIEPHQLTAAVNELLQQAANRPINNTQTPVKHAIVKQVKTKGK